MLKKKKRHPRHRTPRVRSIPWAAAARLDEVDSLVTREQWDEARELVEELNAEYPNRQEILRYLADISHEQEDMVTYQEACERLVKIDPADPVASVGLAAAYLVNGYPALATRDFRQFVRRWPDHPRAVEAGQALELLEPMMESLLTDLGVRDENALEVGAEHEWVRSLLERNRFDEACKAGNRFLARFPDFIPVLNNVSMAYFGLGSTDRAVAMARRVLELEPGNIQALSNLVRFSFLQGDVEAAKEYAGRLKSSNAAAVEPEVRKAEAFSILGDDRAVLDLMGTPEREEELEEYEESPYLFHLAAVAAMRSGQEGQAQRYWGKALELLPDFDLVLDNLNDLEFPPADRDAPWPFSFNFWIPEATSISLQRHLEKGLKQQHDADAMQVAARRFLSEHAEMNVLIPALLDRGDVDSRGFAFTLAMSTATPEILMVLRDFGRGQRGTDEMRQLALWTAVQAGLIPPAPIRLWLNGEWREFSNDEDLRKHVQESIMANLTQAEEE